MLHNTPDFSMAIRAMREAPTPLHRYLQDNYDGLANAAGLLSGTRGVRLVATLAEGLAACARLDRPTAKCATDLLAILNLELVDDPRRPEAAFFAEIDPADPCVEEICLLTDGLRDAIAMSSCPGSSSVGSVSAA